MEPMVSSVGSLAETAIAIFVTCMMCKMRIVPWFVHLIFTIMRSAMRASSNFRDRIKTSYITSFLTSRTCFVQTSRLSSQTWLKAKTPCNLSYIQPLPNLTSRCTSPEHSSSAASRIEGCLRWRAGCQGHTSCPRLLQRVNEHLNHGQRLHRHNKVEARYTCLHTYQVNGQGLL
eukprot:1146458-Pelagomonas_calceolata.AAC.5